VALFTVTTFYQLQANHKPALIQGEAKSFLLPDRRKMKSLADFFKHNIYMQAHVQIMRAQIGDFHRVVHPCDQH
jgi:hypothetical protein